MISAWRQVQVSTILDYKFPLLRNLLETDLKSMNFAKPKKRQMLNHPIETSAQLRTHRRLSWKIILTENELTAQKLQST